MSDDQTHGPARCAPGTCAVCDPPAAAKGGDVSCYRAPVHQEATAEPTALSNAGGPTPPAAAKDTPAPAAKAEVGRTYEVEADINGKWKRDSKHKTALSAFECAKWLRENNWPMRFRVVRVVREVIT